MRYQVDRLYLTRNRIVHHGSLDEHGEDLWIHLEYYVGRMIAAGLRMAQERAAAGQLIIDAPWRELGARVLSGFEATRIFAKAHSDKVPSEQDLGVSGLFEMIDFSL